MKEEASPREAAHLRREGGGRSQEMQYIHFELLKEQVKSRFSYVPVTNVPFRIRFPHCTLHWLRLHVFAVVKYVGCFALPSIARICTFQGT